MRKLLLAGLVAFSAFVTACSPPDGPVFGPPIEVSIPAGIGVSGPRFSEGTDGDLVLSWMESGESGTTLLYSPLSGDSFTTPNRVVTEPRMFVNWADLPSVMHIRARHWIAHWLRYSSDETYSYDVVVSQSFDDGMSWTEAVTAHNDGTPTEHGFVSMHPEADGVALLWLDGRDTANEPGNNALETSMTLRAAVMAPDGQLNREQLVDDSVCDCCQTDVAVSSGGPVAVYRDRTIEEVRDIYITRYAAGKWQPGTRLYEDNWVIAGCPVNGPSIVAQDEIVAVAWFSAANNRPVVRVLLSADGGTTFAEPVEVSAGRISGYVGLDFLGDNSLAASWVSRNASGSNTLNVRRITRDGHLDATLEVAEISQLRVFPQLAHRQENLFLVWTDESDDGRHMQAVRIPVELH